jgi:hypothetical protein
MTLASGYKHWQDFVEPESASDWESRVSLPTKKRGSRWTPPSVTPTDCFSHLASYSAGLVLTQPAPFKV